MERKSGYYRVLYGNTWIVLYWNDIAGSFERPIMWGSDIFNEKEFEFIDEFRIPMPEKTDPKTLLTLAINDKIFVIDEEVFNLINSISLERDEYKNKLLKLN